MKLKKWLEASREMFEILCTKTKEKVEYK